MLKQLTKACFLLGVACGVELERDGDVEVPMIEISRNAGTDEQKFYNADLQEFALRPLIENIVSDGTIPILPGDALEIKITIDEWTGRAHNQEA